MADLEESVYSYSGTLQQNAFPDAQTFIILLTLSRQLWLKDAGHDPLRIKQRRARPECPGGTWTAHSKTKGWTPPQNPVKKKKVLSITKSRVPFFPLYKVSDAGGCLWNLSSRNEWEHAFSGRPSGWADWGASRRPPIRSDKHTHTGKDYCQLVYSHKVIFALKLELSLKEKMEKREHSHSVISRQHTHTGGNWARQSVTWHPGIFLPCSSNASMAICPTSPFKRWAQLALIARGQKQPKCMWARD